MCHVRGFKHEQCGHTTYRRISSCRGTYASPRCPRTPRCSPSATIVISVSDNCRECEYQVFCGNWQKRIDEVRSRRDSFQSLLSEHNLEASDNYWGSELDDEQSWGEQIATEPSRLRRRSTAPAKVEEPKHFCDNASLREERNRLSDEIDRLNIQYNKDAWEHWKPFIGGMSEDQWAKASRMRRRSTKPRFSGSSPLKEVVSSDEICAPAACDIPEIIEEEPSLCSSASDSDVSSRSTSPSSAATKTGDALNSAFWSSLSNDSLRCPLTAQALSSTQTSEGLVMEWRKSLDMPTPKIVERAPAVQHTASSARASGLTGKLKRLQVSGHLQVPKQQIINRRMSLSPTSPSSPSQGMLPNWGF